MSGDAQAVDVDQLGQLAYSGQCSAVVNALNSNESLASRLDKVILKLNITSISLANSFYVGLHRQTLALVLG